MYDGTLTAEHLRIVDEVRAEAMSVALATGPLDHDEVEASILRVYDLLPASTYRDLTRAT
jgi:hypothetical protein